MSNDPDGLNQIYHKLGNIEGKLDALAITMTGHSVQDDLRFSSIEKKLESLQQGKWFNSGVAATVSSFVTVVVLWFRGH